MTYPRALEILEYHTKRNHIAWKSHRQIRLRELAKQKRQSRMKGPHAPTSLMS
jgi:hypothetical protein